MSKIFTTVLLVFFSFGFLYGAGNQEHALALINHVNWVVSKVVTTKSKVALETEYDGISADGLYLDCIEDQETIDAITSVMDALKAARLNEMEREVLYSIFEEDKKNLIYNAIPNPTAIISPDIRSVAINLASSVVTGYMRYKQAERELNKQLTKENFELNKKQIDYLHTLQKDLLQKHYELVRKYNLQDKNRLTVKLLEELNLRINDTNANYQKRTYEYLVLNEDAFKYLPEYWYFRGVYAGMNNKSKDEMNSYEQYQKNYYPFLRNNKVASSVAMNKCQLLIASKGKTSEIEHQLDIILANARNEDWELNYFCGLIYFHHLSKPDKAYSCLQKSVNYLDFEFSNTINDYYSIIDKTLLKERYKCELPNWTSDALSVCRTELLHTMLKCRTDNQIAEYFTNLSKNQTASAYEFIPLFGKNGLRECDFTNNLYRSLYCKIHKGLLNDNIDILLPTLFFYSGKDCLDIILYSKNKKVAQIKEHYLFYTEIGGSKCPWEAFRKKNYRNRGFHVRFPYNLRSMQKQEIDCIELRFANKYHPIVIKFNNENLVEQIDKHWLHPTQLICDSITYNIKSEYPKWSKAEITQMLKQTFNEK